MNHMTDEEAIASALYNIAHRKPRKKLKLNAEERKIAEKLLETAFKALEK